MAQIFSPGATTLFRTVLVLTPFLLVGGLFGLYRFNYSAWQTQVGVPKDQPVPFSHQHHVAGLGIDCRYCHTSAIATVALAREQQGDGSALFNIARNLGGSVGTALLSTMITQREQFHDFRIGERVTIYSLEVQRFINSQATKFESQGGDPVLAMKRVYKTLQSSVQLSSFVMAFSECFLVVGSSFSQDR